MRGDESARRIRLASVQSYDHDAVNATELAELLGLAPSPVIPLEALSINAIQNEAFPAPQADSPQCTDLAHETASCAQEMSIGFVFGASLSCTEPPACRLSRATVDEGALVQEIEPSEWLVDPTYEVVDVALLPFEVPKLPNVPELGGDEALEGKPAYEPEVSEEKRARQQAMAFLTSIQELDACHLGWITEIILARRWSTTQGKVRELWHADFSLKAIYLAFQLSEVWRESDVFDERHGEYLGAPSWIRQSHPTLTWVEAIQLVSFYGQNSSVEEIIEFVDAERHIWRQTRSLIHRFSRFKEYLLRHRIVDECRGSSAGWYRTLDPRDGRFFGGCANPEYTTEWWEDDLPYQHIAQRTQHRIYMGDSLDSLIPEPDDGLHWLED